MRSEIMQALRVNYAQQREANVVEEIRRREEAEQKVDGLSDLLNQRQELIFNGVRGILNGSNTADIPKRMSQLNESILNVLRRSGYPENWLDPVYRCPICRDTGYVGDTVREMCTCMRDAYKREILRQIGIDYSKGASFEQFDESLIPQTPIPDWNTDQRKLSRQIMEQAQLWVQGFPNGPKIILMIGESGLGKTYLMQCIARALTEQGRDVVMLSANQLIEAARKAIFMNDDEPLNACVEAECLFIDDLGSEPMIANVTTEQLYDLLNKRLQAERSTVISTNLDSTMLKKRYGERILSRLTDVRNSLHWSFRGKDLRLARGLGGKR